MDAQILDAIDQFLPQLFGLRSRTVTLLLTRLSLLSKVRQDQRFGSLVSALGKGMIQAFDSLLC